MSKNNSVLLNKFQSIRKEYNPNVIHNLGMCEIIINDDSSSQYTDKSVTDKESYRITLANMRSFLNNPNGSANVGSYSIPAGSDYNPDFDFSYLNRKDLTIVDITNFINTYRDNLDNYNDELKVKIQAELDKADQLLKVKESESKDNSSSASQ